MATRCASLPKRASPAVFASLVAIALNVFPAVAQRGPDEKRRPLAPDKRALQPDAPRPLGPRGPGFRPGFGPPPGLWKRMTDREREEIEAFAEEHFPRMFLELQRLKNKNPERFERRMGRIAPEVRGMMELMQINPERGALRIRERQLDVQLRHLDHKYRLADDADKRKRMRKEFRELLTKSFECRHQRRAMEIRELEARIAELKQRHEEAAKMRDKLIMQELKHRLGDPDE